MPISTELLPCGKIKTRVISTSSNNNNLKFDDKKKQQQLEIERDKQIFC